MASDMLLCRSAALEGKRFKGKGRPVACLFGWLVLVNYQALLSKISNLPFGLSTADPGRLLAALLGVDMPHAH